MTDITIQKFGGTLLADKTGRQHVINVIKRTLAAGVFPVVVVSAMGRIGDPYATDSLLKVAKLCGGRLDSRSHDLIASCGEVISTVVLAQLLKSHQVPALPMTGGQAGIVTDAEYANSKVKMVDIGRLLELVDEEVIPVVAGFQGITSEGEVTTIGRGGSDTTACILGAALNANSVEIYTDVDGVMTADPRNEPLARRIPKAEYSEIRALAINGGKVIHPHALEVSADARLPVVIRSTSKDSLGTIIHFDQHGQPVTGVASYPNITFFRIKPTVKRQYATDLHMFRLIAQRKISVHFIDIRPHEVTFVVEDQSAAVVEDLLHEAGLSFVTDKGLVKVSVVGLGMTGQPGMMAVIVEALAESGIRIYQSTDAQTSISCLIKKSDEQTAIRALHGAFKLDSPIGLG